MSSDNDLYQIAVLIDDLKNEDVQLRLKSMKRLQDIAKVLGPERTVDELLPFLNDSIDDEDEVLLVLAEELGNFTDCVGGPSKAVSLLTPLESLATVEESTVRDKAIQSITKIISVMSEENLIGSLIQLVERLSHRDWFTSRISACGLIPVIYKSIKSNKKESLVELYITLCKDTTPIVRRSAAFNLPTFIPLLAPDKVKSAFYDLFIQFSIDDQESVRLISIDISVALAPLYDEKERLDKLFPIISKLSQDQSWRIRYSVANKITDIFNIFPANVVVDKILPIYEALLEDKEKEVRTVSSFNIGNIIHKLSKDIVVKKIIPLINKLSVDQCEYTKSALAQNFLQLCPLLGEGDTEKFIIPVFTALLKDNNSDVRLNLLSKINMLYQVIGNDEISKILLPAIKTLAEDPQWRVRLAIISHIPNLAKQVGQGIFDKGLTDICLKWVVDQVYTIRENSIKTIKEIVQIFKDDYFTQKILPFISSTLQKHTHYLYRLTCLFFIKEIYSVVNATVLEKQLLPIIAALGNDPVPNVRFNVAKTLEVVGLALTKQVQVNTVKPLLANLMIDSDTDVKFFAQRALSTIEKQNK